MSEQKNLAVIGAEKIINSRSPLIHKYWIKKYGLAADYRRVQIDERADFAKEFLYLFSAQNPQKLYGANITVPYKEAAYRALKESGAELSALAQGLRAVNLVYRKGDNLCGDNTDGDGFLSSLYEGLDKNKQNILTDKPILILGAGGAARAIIARLAKDNNEIYLSNRTRRRAQDLVADLSLPQIRIIDWDCINEVAPPCYLLINTSALGMGEIAAQDKIKINELIEALPQDALVCDIVYTPLNTEFLRSARARSLTAIDGLAMLLGQAALSFKLWFDILPEIDDGLRKELTTSLNPTPIKIGLTGSIGMGKSETARLFAAQGLAVYDADAAVHKLYARGGAAVDKIKEIFPSAIVDEAVDRARLAKLVLGDSKKIKELEAIVHPLAGAAQQEFLEQNKDAAMVVLDIPLLFESGGAERVDYVVVVSAPSDVQRERVLAREGMTAEKFEQIKSRQLPDSEKRAHADFIVDSSKSIADAAAQVRDIIIKLEELADNE